MPSVCFYFEVHQPYRLKPYGALQVGRDHDYFDEKLNARGPAQGGHASATCLPTRRCFA